MDATAPNLPIYLTTLYLHINFIEYLLLSCTYFLHTLKRREIGTLEWSSFDKNFGGLM